MSRLIETYDAELNFIAGQNNKLKESFTSLSEELSQTVVNLSKKEQETTQLRLTSDKINFEN